MKKIYRVEKVTKDTRDFSDFKNAEIQRMKSLDLIDFHGSTTDYHRGVTIMHYRKKP